MSGNIRETEHKTVRARTQGGPTQLTNKINLLCETNDVRKGKL